MTTANDVFNAVMGYAAKEYQRGYENGKRDATRGDNPQERTCEYDYFQDAKEANWLDKVECQGYHVLKCGHRVPGDYFERPNYCCVCGAKVVS